MEFKTLIATVLKLEEPKVATAVQLFDDGATVPFIARYRKDMTGGLDETQLRDILDRYEYFKEVKDRKATIVKSIAEQGIMTPEIQKSIDDTWDKVRLEDIYLPYKPKRRTKATIAKEKGLEPLSKILLAQEASTNTDEDIARIYCSEEHGITSPQAAIQGAKDIIAEIISENPAYRQHLREVGELEAVIVSKVRKEFDGKPSKFENYYEFSEKVKDMPSHRILAIRRGEKEKVLRVSMEINDDSLVNYLQRAIVTGDSIWKAHLEKACQDAYDRLMRPSLETEVRLFSKGKAEDEAFIVFGKNLRDVLLAAPAGQKATLALDPGFRSGCKVAVMDSNGKFLDTCVIYPNEPQRQTVQSMQIIKNLIIQYDVEMIAIGNGTASRETDAFASKVIANLDKKPIKVVVSEAGASVYSASPEAVKEFPKLDVTTRGAISIGRRLQDPLAELVKVEPKSIGVGQYQHDMNQTKLKRSLDQVVESCVNNVGVELNTASASLLSYVAGISKTIAQSIVDFRDSKGSFASRAHLLDVPRFGPKAYEQAAGFLRISGASNKLDASGVHPENYKLVEEIAKDLDLEINTLIGNSEAVKKADKSKYLEKVGEHTLQDILSELEKPGRDPRSEFQYAKFNDKIQTINDLVTNSWMEGVVTNVTNFGAFVDVGVHQDGLIHISELGDQYVKDAKEVYKVGDIVKVRVLAVDAQQKRIALSCKSEGSEESPRHGGGGRHAKGSSNQNRGQGSGDRSMHQSATIADLKQKFKGKGNGNGNGGGHNQKKVQPQKPKISIKALMKGGR